MGQSSPLGPHEVSPLPSVRADEIAARCAVVIVGAVLGWILAGIIGLSMNWIQLC